MSEKCRDRRIRATTCFISMCLLLFLCLLVKTQIINADMYSSAKSAVASYNISVEASRGEITDRNGVELIANRQGNSIVFTYRNFPKAQNERNDIILSLINYLESKQEEWYDNLPLDFDKSGNIIFREDRESDIAYLKSENMLRMNSYATAQNCFDGIIEYYQLTEFSKTDAKKIASVCFGMQRQTFSNSSPYTFAKDISSATASYIKENSSVYKGVDITIHSYRSYMGDGSLASHIIGITGMINADEYNDAKAKQAAALNNPELTDTERIEILAKAYAYNDTIGKSGIESSMESYLRGSKGTLSVTTNTFGESNEDYSVKPVQGGTVVATLDSGLQAAAEEALENTILSATTPDAIAHGLSPAGAVVVLGCNTGEVLASASYPDYSLATYYENYNNLSADPGKPLWNRAFQSTYSPGSTFKCVVAAAALEEGLIDDSYTYYCEGTYTFGDKVFACYNHKSHGAVNVRTALQESCNIFFYDLAKQLGIDKIDEYASLFGLGQKTGIEVSESTGILASKSYRETMGGTWQGGDTLLAAIGQGDHSFTPIQLANYVATIANGGTRYKPYLVKEVLSSDYSSVLYERTPIITQVTGLSKYTLNAVQEGMWLVANEGSCKSVFEHLPFEVACKTGTAEKSVIVDGNIYEGTNGFLITYGPYDDAEIAIAVVVENVGSGSITAEVARALYEYYYNEMNTSGKAQRENILLG